jgi:hypothetical protein
MNLWQILGIAPTRDQALIRRAYARQLKQHRPESDPEGYQRLREAFDAARALAGHGVYGDTDVIDRDTGAADGHRDVQHRQPSEAGMAWHQPEPVWAEGKKALPVPLYTDDDLARLAEKLVNTEMMGIVALDKLWRQLTQTGSLIQQQQFHPHLAQALADQPGLTESGLERISDRLGWGLDNYDSGQIVPQTLQEALNERLRQTALCRAWEQLKVEEKYGSPVLTLALRLLKSDRDAVPAWVRLVPGLLTAISRQINALQPCYPELIQRFNPEVVAFVRQERIAVSWGQLFLLAFWASLLALVIPLSGVSTGAAVSAIAVVLFYLMGSDIALIGLLRWPGLLSAYLLAEFMFSLLAIFFFQMGILFLAVTHSEDEHLRKLLGLFYILIFIASWFAWSRRMPFIRRPGGMMHNILAGPWLMCRAQGKSFLTLTTIPVYFVLYFSVTYELLKLLP